MLSGASVAVVAEKFKKLQNRAVRILMCANYDSNIDELRHVPRTGFGLAQISKI